MGELDSCVELPANSSDIPAELRHSLDRLRMVHNATCVTAPDTASDAVSSHAERRILERGREVLINEGAALLAMSQSLGGSFIRTVELIAKLPHSGRVLTTGMGKSGYVAMKLSASLASVGIRSFFVHPAESMHGDLGRIGGDDLLLVLSNSGENFETLSLVSYAKSIGCTVLSITGNGDSSLAKASSLVISYAFSEEACPLGLAPTTTTTVMLGICDAIVVGVMEQISVTRVKFGQLHPGGSLGKRTSLLHQVMRMGTRHCILPQNLSVRETLHAITLTAGKPGAASIVDDSGKLVGVFTDGDLRRCLVSGVEFLSRPVEEFMSRNPKTSAPDAFVEDTVKMMKTFQIDQVVVVDASNHPVGMVDIQDVC